MAAAKSVVKKEIVSAVRSYEIDQPSQMVSMSTVLKNHIVKHKLYTDISGKNYAHVEGWGFAGSMLGLYPVITSVESIGGSTEFKWKAVAEIRQRKDGSVVSVGVAICSNKENKKKGFDEYAVVSMAQTRAIGKAYRNLLGWVMKLAGYEGTPAEEMKKMGETSSELPSVAPGGVLKATAHVKKPGQVEGPDGEPTYVCSVNDEPISQAEYDFSMKMYGKPLSRAAQKDFKKTSNA